MVKSRTCITIDEELLEKAKNHKLNISNMTEMTILRELESFEKNAYTKALEAQNNLLKKFIMSRTLMQDYEEWKLLN